jgi:hypothetical protein
MDINSQIRQEINQKIFYSLKQQIKENLKNEIKNYEDKIKELEQPIETKENKVNLIFENESKNTTPEDRKKMDEKLESLMEPIVIEKNEKWEETLKNPKNSRDERKIKEVMEKMNQVKLEEINLKMEQDVIEENIKKYLEEIDEKLFLNESKLPSKEKYNILYEFVFEEKTAPIFKDFKDLSEIRDEIKEFLELENDFMIDNLDFNQFLYQNQYQIKIDDKQIDFSIRIKSLIIGFGFSKTQSINFS